MRYGGRLRISSEEALCMYHRRDGSGRKREWRGEGTCDEDRGNACS